MQHPGDLAEYVFSLPVVVSLTLGISWLCAMTVTVTPFLPHSFAAASASSIRHQLSPSSSIDATIGLARAEELYERADLITILYGYSPESETIVGMQVLATKETPGLGDKIEKDERFVANFDALDVRLNDAGSAPANPIVTVKQGEKTEAWEIDGITGATISSVAIGDMLRASTARWAPVVTSNVDAFSAGGDDEGT